MEDERTGVRRIAKPVIDYNRNLVEVNYSITVTDKQSGQVEQFDESHQMRYFFSPEVSLFAKLAQMDVLHSEHWMDGSVPSPDTWGVSFVLQKRSSVRSRVC